MIVSLCVLCVPLRFSASFVLFSSGSLAGFVFSFRRFANLARLMFDRYRSLIPDFASFQEAIRQPRDMYLRVNPLRIAPAEFAQRMAAAGHALTPVPWYPSAFLAPPGLADRPGTLEHFLGLYYVQGAPSMIPPLALEPQPGERVLDLCAAPGSKTTQICELMQDRGFVVANDIYFDRLKILKGHLERLGITCAMITRKPGNSFPGGLLFDRVLVDAPCSGEGTVRGEVEMGRARAPAEGAPAATDARSDGGLRSSATTARPRCAAS
jgi:16S rRNA C967 or C1407 C5-methylase (RsmB/RsmF family)